MYHNGILPSSQRHKCIIDSFMVEHQRSVKVGHGSKHICITVLMFRGEQEALACYSREAAAAAGTTSRTDQGCG